LDRYAYAQNNPLKYVDPDGHIPVETIADIVSIGYSLAGFIKEPSWANAGYLAWDVGAAVAPYVPGSYAAKTVKVGSKVAGKINIGKRAFKPGQVKQTASVSNKAPNRADFYVSPGGQAIPSRGYRAIGGKSNIAEALEGTIFSRNPTFITFDNLRGMNSREVRSLLQLPKTPSHAVQFDTLQILDDLSIPTGEWNTTNIPEPITNTKPRWGKGGGTQAITKKPITINDMWQLKK
jgi:hypothetical protein